MDKILFRRQTIIAVINTGEIYNNNIHFLGQYYSKDIIDEIINDQLSAYSGKEVRKTANIDYAWIHDNLISFRIVHLRIPPFNTPFFNVVG